MRAAPSVAAGKRPPFGRIMPQVLWRKRSSTSPSPASALELTATPYDTYPVFGAKQSSVTLMRAITARPRELAFF